MPPALNLARSVQELLERLLRGVLVSTTWRRATARESGAHLLSARLPPVLQPEALGFAPHVELDLQGVQANGDDALDVRLGPVE